MMNSLEQSLGDRGVVAERLGELERALHVAAGGGPLAVMAMAAGAALEDAGAELVARLERAVADVGASVNSAQASATALRASSASPRWKRSAARVWCEPGSRARARAPSSVRTASSTSPRSSWAAPSSIASAANRLPPGDDEVVDRR